MAAAALGTVAVVLFAYLGANYLQSEKQFRRLYTTVARLSRKVPLYTLDPIDADEPRPDDEPATLNGSDLKARRSIPQSVGEYAAVRSVNVTIECSTAITDAISTRTSIDLSRDMLRGPISAGVRGSRGWLCSSWHAPRRAA